jgi:DNA invertase Pin-like site-specific DNA recombinase
VQVIDDDLSRSGGGIVRPGFEKLLAAIRERRIGAVLSIEASRLDRNGRDWHTLLEFCAGRHADRRRVAMLTSNTIVAAIAPGLPLTDQARPTSVQRRAYELLELAL